MPRPADAVVSINGTDLATFGLDYLRPDGTPMPFGLYVADPGALLDGLTADGSGDASTALAGRLGVTGDGVPAPAGARDLTLTLALRARTPDEVLAARDAVVALFPPNAPLVLRTALDPTRESLVRRVKLGSTVTAPAFLQRDVTLAVGLRLLTPSARARATRVLGLDATATPVPLGTLPVEPVVQLFAPAGAVTTPTVRVRDLAGRIVASLTLAGTFGAGSAAEVVEIDCLRKTITTQLAADAFARVDAYGWMTATGAAGDFLTLDPRDGDPIASAYPTLEVVAASGTPTGRVLYRPTWE